MARPYLPAIHCRFEEVVIVVVRKLPYVPIAAALTLVSATSAAAQEQVEAEAQPDRWDVAAEASLTDQSGNRVLRLFTGGLQVSHRETEAFELEATAESRYGKSDDEVVARSHFASLTLDLQPGDVVSPFLYSTAERDRFKRLDLRFSGGAGAKYTPYRSGSDEASLSLALLYSHERQTPDETGAADPDRHLARWSLRARGTREIREGVEVRQVTFYQPIFGRLADYLLRSETGATVLITERLALSVSYRLDRTSRPPEDVAPDDRLLKTGLIIQF